MKLNVNKHLNVLFHFITHFITYKKAKRNILRIIDRERSNIQTNNSQNVDFLSSILMCRRPFFTLRCE